MPEISVLFSEKQIQEKIAQLGAELTDFFAGNTVIMVALACGAVPFAVDLGRAIRLPIYADCVSVSRYVNDKPSDTLVFRGKPKLPWKGARILLVDDVLDTGVTLNRLKQYSLDNGALDVHTVVAVTKDIKRAEGGLAEADWSLFHCGDDYLVGYGMDSHELYRNLPYIGILKG